MPVTEAPDVVVDVPRFALKRRRFGVEIEFVAANPNAVMRTMRRHGVSVGGYDGYDASAWDMDEDGSVSEWPYGELRSPPLSGYDGARQIALACHALRANGGNVNRSCGLHVHHEAVDLDAPSIVRLAKSYRASAEAIGGLVSQSRRTNSYCASIPGNLLATLDEAVDLDDLKRRAFRTHRYALNFYNLYGERGTIEFRQHQGTINPKKILAWVAFGQAMITMSAAGITANVTSTNDLIALLVEHGELGATAAKFLRRRASVIASR